jgi:riboflavin synthase
MFSGIIEAVGQIEDQQDIHPGLTRIKITRPQVFDDLKHGDSIAVNGLCLTLESFDEKYLNFALGAETLKILSSNGSSLRLMGQQANLERSLRIGDRIHGHWVLGHVDEKQKILERTDLEEVTLLKIFFSDKFRPFIFNKGSITVNGVSLTVNEIGLSGGRNFFSICLIPETLKRTNLANVKVGDSVLLEFDWFSKIFSHQIQSMLETQKCNLPVNS